MSLKSFYLSVFTLIQYISDLLNSNSCESIEEELIRQSLNSHSVPIVTSAQHYMNSSNIETPRDKAYLIRLCLKRFFTVMIFVAILITGILCHVFVNINDIDVNQIYNTTQAI